MIVLDASVALQWYLAETNTDPALRLLGAEEPMVAPDVLLVEVGEAAWTLVRQERMRWEQAALIAATLPDYFTELYPTAWLAERALAIAASVPLSIHDCLYLALAQRLQTILVTADPVLMERLAGNPWAAQVKLLGDFVARG